jgi:hypothetical protein
VFTAQYALSPYIKQIRFVFKGLMTNESKTKYMQINTNITNLEQDLIINRQLYEGV